MSYKRPRKVRVPVSITEKETNEIELNKYLIERFTTMSSETGLLLAEWTADFWRSKYFQERQRNVTEKRKR